MRIIRAFKLQNIKIGFLFLVPTDLVEIFLNELNYGKPSIFYSSRLPARAQ